MPVFNAICYGTLICVNGETSMQDVLRKLAYTSSGEISPMAAMFGGVVGQEVMKAASGKFHPLFQFFYFDSIESLPEEDLTPEDVVPQA